MSDVKASIFLLSVVSSLVLFVLVGVVSTRKNPGVVLQVNNPYSWKVSVEVKCEWSTSLNRFRFVEKYSLCPERVTTIVVPPDMTSCQIWPHVHIW